MRPIEFKHQNTVFTKPHNITDAECAPLPAYKNDKWIVSCWRMSWKERLKALVYGTVWLWVIGGVQPPIGLEVDKDIFTEGGE